MSKTSVSHKETSLGIVNVQEIEAMIMDNLIQVQKFLFRNYRQLPIGEYTVKQLHKLLALNLFADAGNYRTHDVQLGHFEPPHFYAVAEQMSNWEADYHERQQHAKNTKQKIELCAWLMHRFLWVHPFFDYNGRVSRLLGELFLLQNKLPIIPFHSVARIDFVKAVKIATAKQDLSALTQLMTRQLKR